MFGDLSKYRSKVLKNERWDSQKGSHNMTNTNSDQWGPGKISPYPLSLKLRTKRSKKLHKYVTQNVLISENISMTVTLRLCLIKRR